MATTPHSHTKAAPSCAVCSNTLIIIDIYIVFHVCCDQGNVKCDRGLYQIMDPVQEALDKASQRATRIASLDAAGVSQVDADVGDGGEQPQKKQLA